MTLSRRSFFAAAPALCGAAALQGPAHAQPSSAAGPDPFPRQDADAVREVVGASHRNLERVRELVTARPALAKAVWDWGFGDWESALGAAAHTGRREIAAFLIEHGARPDLFTHAMLGNLDAVRAICQSSPGVQRIPGPHGIPLLAHAKAGGEQAAAVVEYLETLGDAGVEQRSIPLSEPERAAYFGAFRIDGGGASFEIKEQRDLLTIVHAGGPIRLFNQGEHEFHPAGAPAVRLRFRMQDGRAAGVQITDGPHRLTATRQA